MGLNELSGQKTLGGGKEKTNIGFQGCAVGRGQQPKTKTGKNLPGFEQMLYSKPFSGSA